MIKNAEDEANIKYKQVFKPIIDRLANLIKEKEYPVTNMSNKNVTQLSSSVEYQDGKDLTPEHSSSYNDSEYFDNAEESPKLDDSPKSIGKEDDEYI